MWKIEIVENGPALHCCRSGQKFICIWAQLQRYSAVVDSEKCTWLHYYRVHPSAVWPRARDRYFLWVLLMFTCCVWSACVINFSRWGPLPSNALPRLCSGLRFAYGILYILSSWAGIRYSLLGEGLSDPLSLLSNFHRIHSTYVLLWSIQFFLYSLEIFLSCFTTSRVYFPSIHPTTWLIIYFLVHIFLFLSLSIVSNILPYFYALNLTHNSSLKKHIAFSNK